MTTIERFYFNFKDAECCISMGADGTDYHLAFVGSDEDPITLEIKMRGKDNFRQMIAAITSMGASICDEPTSLAACSGAPRTVDGESASLNRTETNKSASEV